MEKFTLEEIRRYIQSQDSLGDVLYNLTPGNIRKASIDYDGNIEDDYPDPDWEEADERGEAFFNDNDFDDDVDDWDRDF